MAVVPGVVVLIVTAETRFITSCMAVVLEVVSPVATTGSPWMAAVLVVVVPETTAQSSWLEVVLEEVAPACSWRYQTFCYIAVHSSYLKPLHVGIAVSDTC